MDLCLVRISERKNNGTFKHYFFFTERPIDAAVPFPFEVQHEPVTMNVSPISNSRPTAAISNEPVEVLVDSELRSMDNRKLMIQPSNETKKYFCSYCKKVVVKLPRHLEKMHKEEDDVRKLRFAKGIFFVSVHLQTIFI